MANTSVALLRYCKTASGWRRMRVSTIRKGRGWIEKIETSHLIIEKGEYQLRWYMGSKAKFKGVGDNLSDAIVARDNQASILALEKAAKDAGRALVPETGTKSRTVLAKAKDEFIKRKENIIRRGGVPLCRKTIEGMRVGTREGREPFAHMPRAEQETRLVCAYVWGRGNRCG